MFLSILPISVVCLVLVYSGWEIPDVHLSSSTQLIPLRVSYGTDIYSTPSITSLVLFEDDNPSLALGYCDITRPPEYDDVCGIEILDNGEISSIRQLTSEGHMFGRNVRCPQLYLPPIDMVKMMKIEKTKSTLIVYHDKNGICYENYPDDTDSDLVCSREEVRLDGDTENHNLVILVIFLHLLLLQFKHGLLGRLYSSYGMGFSLTSKNTKNLKDLDIDLDLEYTEFANKIKILKNQIDDKRRHLEQKEVDLTTVRAQLIEFEKTAPLDVVKQLNKNLRRNIDSGLNIKRIRPSWQDKIDIHKYGRPMGNGYMYGSRRRPRRA